MMEILAHLSINENNTQAQEQNSIGSSKQAYTKKEVLQKEGEGELNKHLVNGLEVTGKYF